MSEEAMKSVGLRAPWEAVPGDVEGRWFVHREDREYREDGTIRSVPIAVVDYSRDGHEPTRLAAWPVARLMATAPELLEALKLADKWMGEWNRPDWVGPTIRAAIAKAEGRS
jgi:hypothetical protein